MPAVGDLRRIGKGPLGSQRISTAAIARDNRDLRLAHQPSLCRGGLAVWQKGDRPASIKVANESSITVIAAPGPIVNSNHRRRWERRRPKSPNNTQQCVVADRHHQPTSEAGSRSAAERKRHTKDDLIEPCGATRPRREDTRIETFGENLPNAGNLTTLKAPREENQPHS
jgi:hypothetical protein